MKWIIVCLLIIAGRWMRQDKQETVPYESEDNVQVAWLRDAQSAERNAEVKVGSFFVTERNTVYGADCKGCTLKDGVASTSSQIEVTQESVRQSDGTWKKGMTYDGYYLIAADSALPMCTVVRISDHSYSGAGIEKNQPFLALVVDRGSMIQNQTIDLFAGSERNPLIQHEELSGALVEIVGFLNYTKNKNGQMSCAGE